MMEEEHSMEEKHSMEEEHSRDAGWITGRIYCNRNDKRWIVRRPRNEFSYTMNLGNGWTWIFSIFVILIIFAAFIVL